MIRVGCKIAKKGKRSNINHIEITTIITQTLGHRPRARTHHAMVFCLFLLVQSLINKGFWLFLKKIKTSKIGSFKM
jgi:hypothetical protein